MTLNTNSERTDLTNRAGGQAMLADAADLSGDGVEVAINNVPRFTLYLSVPASTSVDITIELSPDGGQHWYEPRDNSPVAFASTDDASIEHIPYHANRLRLSASNSTAVTAQLREVV